MNGTMGWGWGGEWGEGEEGEEKGTRSQEARSELGDQEAKGSQRGHVVKMAGSIGKSSCRKGSEAQR